MTKKSKDIRVKPDTRFKTFWQSNDRFADLFNATVFHGKQVVTSESLQERDTECSTIVALGNGNLTQGIARSRDIMKVCDLGGNFLLLGVENQTHIHYGMPLKALTYDVLGYIKQCNAITYRRKKNKELATTEEFLSGMKATDLLQPIITLVLYYGEEPWSGPLTLKDMLAEITPEIEKYIIDYKIILVQVRSDEEYSFQNEDVAIVFHVSQKLFAGKIEEVKKKYQKKDLSPDVLGMIGTITGSKTLIKMSENEGEMNMCKALDEYWDKAKQEGHKEGHKEGHRDGYKEGHKEERRYIVMKMLENNLSEEMICVLTSITHEEIQGIRCEM